MSSRVACLGTGFGYFLFVLYCKDMTGYKKTLRRPTALQRVKRIVRVVMAVILVVGFFKVQFDVAGRPRAFDGQNVKLHKNGCIVLSSTIHDVYNGVDIQQTHKGGQIEIDHIVPLSYAHQHGAAHWTQEKRIEFANDVENLLPVSSKDNSSKGDKGPADWRPTDVSYSCQYGESFLHIIEKYDLTVSQADYTAIQGFC